MFRIRTDRHAALPFRVASYAVAHFPGGVKPRAIVFENVDDTQTLFVVIESTRDQIAEDAFTGMTERSVSEIVSERDRLGEFFIQTEHLRDAARDLRHLERVCQARAVMVAGGREEHLCLVLQTTERLAVDHAIAIALEGGPNRILGFLTQASARVGALRCLRREDLSLAFLHL